MNIAKDLFYSQHALASLFLVVNKLQLHGDKSLQDITLRQMLAIPALIHAPEGQKTINYVARYLGTSRQNAKQIVDSLVKRGYLTSETSPQDRRSVTLAITPEGELAFGVCSTRVDEFLAMIFEGFSMEDLEILCLLLQRLYRFDSDEQDSERDHLAFEEQNSEMILQHHQSYVQYRTLALSKGEC